MTSPRRPGGRPSLADDRAATPARSGGRPQRRGRPAAAREPRDQGDHLAGVTTGSSLAELGQTLETDRGELGRVLGTSSLGKRRVERLEHAAERYARIYPASTPAEIGPGIRDHYQAIASALQLAEPDDHRVRLLKAAARFAGLMSWICFDLNRPGAALDYLDEGIEAAEQAEDRALAGYLIASRNRIASAEGDHQEIRDSGLAAIEITGEGSSVSGRMLAWCYGLVARGRAGMGDHSGTERALARAEQAIGESGRAASGPEMEFFDPARFKALAGECYVFLRHPQHARSNLEETLRGSWSQPS
jgi:hypothetical protein